jgi:hypothetical protein
MHTHNDSEFWADTYRGRPIAILNRQGRWHVYLDHALQYHVLFATAQDAIGWLMQRVDGRGSQGLQPGTVAAD